MRTRTMTTTTPHQIAQIRERIAHEKRNLRTFVERICPIDCAYLEYNETQFTLPDILTTPEFNAFELPEIMRDKYVVDYAGSDEMFIWAIDDEREPVARYIY